MIDANLASATECLGRGTTFRISLLAGESNAMTDRASSQAILQGRQRILFVDDDAMVRRSVHRLVSQRHEVIAAGSGREAHERIRGGERLDVVLCDLMMPEMSGIEVFARLSAERPEIASRVIILSGGAFTPEASSFLADAVVLALAGVAPVPVLGTIGGAGDVSVCRASGFGGDESSAWRA